MLEWLALHWTFNGILNSNAGEMGGRLETSWKLHSQSTVNTFTKDCFLNSLKNGSHWGHGILQKP